MKMRKLFFILTVAAALILTSCSGPGDSETFGGGDGGGGGMFSSSGRDGGGGMFGSGGNNGGGTFGGGGTGGGGNTVATNGRLTINGFPPECNGKYVSAVWGTDVGGLRGLYAYQTLSKNKQTGINLGPIIDTMISWAGGKIVNGSVTLKVWEITIISKSPPDAKMSGYNGNDQNVPFVVSIDNEEDPEWDVNTGFGIGVVYVSFSGGKATGTIQDFVIMP